ncbi:outer membrane protein assembly factor BamE [Planktotalea sp.]|uniref:outer membrane protein assembly factor BamE n=1 Tax=Planktotalea sp. TaxID=2029877 RepID=UPI003D6B0578
MRAIGNTVKFGAALVLCASLAACSATYRNHGYVPLEEDLSQIAVGVDTRETVAERIGTPSSAGVLNESGYYYVQSRVKQFAWQKPEVIDRQVVAVSFTQAGIVENVGRYTLQDGQVVPLARRITRNGQDVSVIRKILSNLGGFSASNFLN